MSLYTRVHTPNSPLLPLSPMPSSSSSSSSMFLSPYTVSLRSRRSFTPNHSNILSPPNLSPIWAGILSNKSYDPHYDSASSEPTFKRPFAVSASRKSMKKLRSSARKEVRHTNANIPLDSIRRSLFAADSPPIGHVKMSPNVSRIDYTQLKSPLLNYSKFATPQRYSSAATAAAAAAAAAAAGTAVPYEYCEPLASPYLNASHNTPLSLLEETFTVMSILKEINMQKYASLFAKEEVDLFVFLLLTHEDMIELGIEKDDHAILMGAIECFTEFFGSP